VQTVNELRRKKLPGEQKGGEGGEVFQRKGTRLRSKGEKIIQKFSKKKKNGETTPG